MGVVLPIKNDDLWGESAKAETHKAHRSTYGPQAAIVLAAIRELGGKATMEQIEEHTGLLRWSICGRIDDLIEAGKVEMHEKIQIAKGIYHNVYRVK